MRAFALIVGAIASIAFSVGMASADQIRTASAFGPNHFAAKGYTAFLKRLSDLTGGKWKGQDFPSGLAAPGEMVSAMRGGLVDVGSMLMPYFPAEFKESNLPSELAMVGKDVRSVAAASAEYILGCAECIEEFKRTSSVYLAGAATTPYDIYSTVPINSVADMKGLRIRTGGAAFTRWAVALGAVPVQMPPTELFQSLSQGLIVAHYGLPADMDSYNLWAVIKHITRTQLGTFNGVSPFSVRLELYRKLSPEERKAFIRAAQFGSATIVFAMMERGDAAFNKAKAAGIAIKNASADLVKANDAYVAKDAAALVKTLTDKGIVDAASKIERFRKLVAKWNGLVVGVNTPEAYTKLLMSEIWDKVDVSTYSK